MLDLPIMDCHLQHDDRHLGLNITVAGAISATVDATVEPGKTVHVDATVHVDTAAYVAHMAAQRAKMAARDARPTVGPSTMDKLLPTIFALMSQFAQQYAEGMSLTRQTDDDMDTQHFGPATDDVRVFRQMVEAQKPAPGALARLILRDALPRWAKQRDKIPAWRWVEAKNWVILVDLLLPDYPPEQLTDLCLRIWSLAMADEAVTEDAAEANPERA